MQFRSTLLPVKLTDSAYIAGMIDGEGTVKINRRAGKGKSENARPWGFLPLVLVTNTHLGVLEHLREVSGVGIVYHAKTRGKPHWNLVHRWQVVGNQARQLLVEVQPHLIIKAEHARQVLAMPTQIRGGRAEGSAEIYGEQERLFGVLTELNRRTPLGVPTKPTGRRSSRG